MKIGLLTACYNPVINGVTRMVMLYAKHLEALGHEPTIFTIGPSHPQDEHYVARTPGRAVGDNSYYATFAFNQQMQQRLKQMDILHAHHLWQSLDFANRYGRADQPIIYTNHSRYDIYTGEYFPLLPKSLAMSLGRAIIRWQWPYQTRKCTAVIAPSPHVKTIMEQYGVKVPIQTIRNGVELDLFTAPPSPLTKAELGLAPNQPTAIYIGRLANEKRILQLLDAILEARTEIPDLHLLIIGNGPQKTDVQEAITGHQLEKSVTLLGWVSFDQIGNYLAAADFFITASQSEVHPLTVIEAAAAGLPIIAPDTQWVTDALPKEAVLASDQLAQSIINIAKDEELRHKTSMAARKASESYDIRHTIDQTVSLYETVLTR